MTSMKLTLPNGCMHFNYVVGIDPGDNTFVNCGSSQTIMPTGSITATCWIKCKPFNTMQYFFGRYKALTNQRSWCFSLDQYDNTGDYDKFTVVLSNTGSVEGTGLDTGKFYHTNINVADNNWHNVAATYTSIIGNDSGLKLYIDGGIQTTLNKERDGSMPFISSNYGVPVTIGSRADLDADYSGCIYDCRLYNRVLNSSEIKDIYNRENISNGLIGHWKFNDNGDLDTIKDWSNNHNDGRVSGGVYWTENDNFNFWCKRWDEDNYNITVETFMNAQDRDMIFGNTIPGSIIERNTKLGWTINLDGTFYKSANTLILEPLFGYGLSGVRSRKIVLVKNISDTFINNETYNVKLELKEKRNWSDYI